MAADMVERRTGQRDEWARRLVDRDRRVPGQSRLVAARVRRRDVTRILVEFRAEDEGAKEILEALNQFQPYTVERAEMEAHLFMVLARCSWRDADRLRQTERRSANRKTRKKKP